jgi:hypothetical protein
MCVCVRVCVCVCVCVCMGSLKRDAGQVLSLHSDILIMLT